MTFPGFCPWLLIPTQPTRASEPAAEEHSLCNCLSSWLKHRVGWKFPHWEFSRLGQLQGEQSGFQPVKRHFRRFHPSLFCSTSREFPASLSPAQCCLWLSGGIYPRWGQMSSTDTQFAQSNCSCAYKVNKQQRRWQEVKKGERIKVKKKQFEQSTPHILPQQKGARTKQGRTLRMSPTLWDICHGQSLLDHRGGAEQAQPGSEASPSKCVCSVPGVILWCLSALYNQQLDEIISLGRCEVWGKCAV